MMTQPTDLRRRVIDALYNEALILADEARAVFDIEEDLDAAERDDDLARIALSCEALRTTTRVMHTIAWLLNQRAYFNGEISELQLRRHGRLPAASAAPDTEHLALIDHDTRRLIESSKRLYERVLRLDQALDTAPGPESHPFDRLRERLIAEAAGG